MPEKTYNELLEELEKLKAELEGLNISAFPDDQHYRNYAANIQVSIWDLEEEIEELETY